MSHSYKNTENITKNNKDIVPITDPRMPNIRSPDAEIKKWKQVGVVFSVLMIFSLYITKKTQLYYDKGTDKYGIKLELHETWCTNKNLISFQIYRLKSDFYTSKIFLNIFINLFKKDIKCLWHKLPLSNSLIKVTYFK